MDVGTDYYLYLYVKDANFIPSREQWMEVVRLLGKNEKISRKEEERLLNEIKSFTTINPGLIVSIDLKGFSAVEPTMEILDFAEEDLLSGDPTKFIIATGWIGRGGWLTLESFKIVEETRKYFSDFMRDAENLLGKQLEVSCRMAI